MDDRYLFSAGYAIAERQKWENEMREGLREWAMLSSTGMALTAASLPIWSRSLRRTVGAMSKIPRAAYSFLMKADPSDTLDDTVDRLAPTLATAAYNNHVLTRLAEEGIPYKMWLTRHDPLVRETHKDADGQTVPLSRPFVVGGQWLQYPADMATASIELWINCRCVAMGRRTL